MNIIHSVEFILNEMDKELDEKISLLSRQRLACMSKSKEVSNLLLKLGEMTKKNEGKLLKLFKKRYSQEN